MLDTHRISFEPLLSPAATVARLHCTARSPSRVCRWAYQRAPLDSAAQLNSPSALVAPTPLTFQVRHLLSHRQITGDLAIPPSFPPSVPPSALPPPLQQPAGHCAQPRSPSSSFPFTGLLLFFFLIFRTLTALFQLPNSTHRAPPIHPPGTPAQCAHPSSSVPISQWRAASRQPATSLPHPI
ncbi:hypothetical protein BD414DRAFT_97878 [Trametes punicea]|nr:hypothetical protein BD414DRAFT_97878 [Trametes punicea]